MLLECLGKIHSNILSIDAEGKLALWAYSPALFEHQGWFRPLRTAVLDLRYLALTQLKVSPAYPLPPQTPHAELEAELQPMRRWREGRVEVQSFQPVRGVPGHHRKIEVQYQRRTTLKDPSKPASVTTSTNTTAAAAAAAAAHVKWSACNVSTSLLSSGVLDVHVTQDGEEVVLLMTYEGLLDDGSGNVNLALTELQRVEKTRLQQKDRVNKSSRSQQRQVSSRGEGGESGESSDEEEGGEEVGLDGDSVENQGSLDEVTDSESEDDDELAGVKAGGDGAEQQAVRSARRTTEDFTFWLRDREQQRESLQRLEKAEQQRDLQRALDRSGALRHMSTVVDHEKVDRGVIVAPCAVCMSCPPVSVMSCLVFCMSACLSWLLLYNFVLIFILAQVVWCRGKPHLEQTSRRRKRKSCRCCRDRGGRQSAPHHDVCRGGLLEPRDLDLPHAPGAVHPEAGGAGDGHTHWTRAEQDPDEGRVRADHRTDESVQPRDGGGGDQQSLARGAAKLTEVS